MARNRLLFGVALCALVTCACSDDGTTTGGGGDADVSADVGGDTEQDGTPDVIEDGGEDTQADADADAAVDGDAGPGGTQLASVLTGGQEAPNAVDTDASGLAGFILSDDETQIDFRIEIADITGVTAAHIHYGPLGVGGPIIFPLPGSDSFSSPFTGTLTEADFTAAAGPGIDTYEDAIAALVAGDTYVNVHTSDNPAGEVRGQIGSQTLRTVLSGGQEAPDAVDTAARGFATFTIAADFRQVDFSITVEDITDVTGAHIHVSALGVPGPIIFPLPGADEFSSPFTGSFDDDDFTAAAAQGVNSYPEAIGVLFDGNAYLNVHTSANPAGEVRGQLGVVRMSASLDGAQEAPDAVTTEATGGGTVTFSADQVTFAYTLSVNNIADVTGAHIHLAERGVPGPILFALPNGADLVDEISGTLTEDDLSELAEQGVTTMRDAVDAILRGETYFNVHTTANPAGEIRGQIEP